MIALIALLLVRHFTLRWFYRRAPPESLRLVVLDTLRIPAVLWCVAAAVQIALEMSIVPDRYIDRAATSIVRVLTVLSVVLWRDRMSLAPIPISPATSISRIVTNIFQLTYFPLLSSILIESFSPLLRRRDES